MHHKVNSDLGAKLPLAGEAHLFAAQARWAINERISLIATKDGYAKVQFKNTLEDEEGFANLSAGIKWSPYIDEQSQSILTLGIRIELPTGESSIHQDKASLINPFISYDKGFGNLHFLAYNGLRLPFDNNNSTTTNDFSLHIDYKTGNFYPLLEVNWTNILKSAEGSSETQHLEAGGSLPTNTIQNGFTGNDLMEFGASDTQGKNYIDLAIGFRYRLF